MGTPLPTDPESRAARKRPEGWRAPGPPPSGPRGREELVPRDAETLSFLCGDWRIFQRRDGHRWSIDDFVTALVAIEEARSAPFPVEHALDLGCGIGSVLMFVAWALPHARVSGVEAQALSAEMAARSLAYNGADGRCVVRVGDLRDGALVERSRFDLVTGSPPYFPLGAGTVPGGVQRGPCCFETRGGIEDYCRAARRALAPGGVFVTCAGTYPADRAERAAHAAELTIVRTVDVVGKEGKPPLFHVHVMRREEDAPPSSRVRREVFRGRLADGALPPEMHAARAVLGLPPVR